MFSQNIFFPNAYIGKEKSDQNCAIVRRTNSVPICIAVNDKPECSYLYLELLIVSFET